MAYTPESLSDKLGMVILHRERFERRDNRPYCQSHSSCGHLHHCHSAYPNLQLG